MILESLALSHDIGSCGCHCHYFHVVSSTSLRGMTMTMFGRLPVRPPPLPVSMLSQGRREYHRLFQEVSSSLWLVFRSPLSYRLLIVDCHCRSRLPSAVLPSCAFNNFNQLESPCEKCFPPRRAGEFNLRKFPAETRVRI